MAVTERVKRRIYLDTSAYLSLLLGERGSKALFQTVRKSIPCSSVLILIETERTLVRLARDKVLSEQDYEIASKQLNNDTNLFILRDLTPDLCLTGIFPAIRLPRSSDLVHIRTALWFQRNGSIESFVTLDRTLAEAAKELGLPVWQNRRS